MAMPGILLQLAKNNPMIARVKQMIGMMNGSQNPSAMLNQMMANNPQMKQVMDIINQHGGDPEKAFRTVAEQNGFRPEDIMEMLK